MNLPPLNTIPNRMVDNVLIVRYRIKSIEGSLLDSSLLHLDLIGPLPKDAHGNE